MHFHEKESPEEMHRLRAAGEIAEIADDRTNVGADAKQRVEISIPTKPPVSVSPLEDIISKAIEVVGC
jgi:hypothetical protein